MQSSVGGLKAGSWRQWALDWAPAAVMALVIFVLSSIPGTKFPEIHFRLADKIVHATVYAILAVLVAIPLHRAKREHGWRRVIVWVTVIGCGYGISDEVHQLFTPFRSAEICDVVADTVGALLGALGYVGVKRLRSRGRPSSSDGVGS